MAQSKQGVKSKKPSHQRYNSEHHRRENKVRRIKKNNGQNFLGWWMANHASTA